MKKIKVTVTEVVHGVSRSGAPCLWIHVRDEARRVVDVMYSFAGDSATRISVEKLMRVFEVKDAGLLTSALECAVGLELKLSEEPNPKSKYMDRALWPASATDADVDAAPKTTVKRSRDQLFAIIAGSGARGLEVGSDNEEEPLF